MKITQETGCSILLRNDVDIDEDDEDGAKEAGYAWHQEGCNISLLLG